MYNPISKTLEVTITVSIAFKTFILLLQPSVKPLVNLVAKELRKPENQVSIVLVHYWKDSIPQLDAQLIHWINCF